MGAPESFLGRQEKIEEGDRDAWREFYSQHWVALVRYARRILHDEKTAEDAAQSALLNAWVEIKAGKPIRNLPAWLYRAVHNNACSHLRQTRPVPLSQDVPLLRVNPRVDPEEVRSILQRLPADLLEVYNLRFIQNLTQEAAAERLGIAVKTFVRLQRKLEDKVRRELQRLLGE